MKASARAACSPHCEAALTTRIGVDAAVDSQILIGSRTVRIDSAKKRGKEASLGDLEQFYGCWGTGQELTVLRKPPLPRPPMIARIARGTDVNHFRP